MYINRVLIALTLILFYSQAFALWKCVNAASGSESFTDTPVYSEGQSCEKVENLRFSKTEKVRTQTKATASTRSPSAAKNRSASANNRSKSNSSPAKAAQKRVVKRGKCPNA